MTNLAAMGELDAAEVLDDAPVLDADAAWASVWGLLLL
jgi:hypothetical protein